MEYINSATVGGDGCRKGLKVLLLGVRERSAATPLWIVESYESIEPGGAVRLVEADGLVEAPGVRAETGKHPSKASRIHSLQVEMQAAARDDPKLGEDHLPWATMNCRGRGCLSSSPAAFAVMGRATGWRNHRRHRGSGSQTCPQDGEDDCGAMHWRHHGGMTRWRKHDEHLA